MRAKKLFGLVLITGFLMLTSCENLLGDILGNFLGDNSQSSIPLEEYEGKEGATELNKYNWLRAFSLGETALRRNVKITCKQEARTMISEIDHGKFKITETIGNISQTKCYYSFTNLEGAVITGDYYEKEGEVWTISNESFPLELTLYQYGILNYDYANFTYDKDTATYKADSYKHSVKYSSTAAMSITISDCTIAIENGFPKKIEFDFANESSQQSSKKSHYVVDYSDYGNVSVNLPKEGREDDQLNVAGNTFKGFDIEEKEFVYYDLYKTVVESSTLIFDKTGICEMITTKAISGNEIKDTYQELYGEYRQTSTGVSITFDIVSDGQEAQKIPSSNVLRYSLDLYESTLVMPTQALEVDDDNESVDLHLLFKIDEPFKGMIEIPAIVDDHTDDSPDDTPGIELISGTYTFNRYDYVVEEGGNEEAAIEAYRNIEEDVFSSYSFVIEDTYQTIIIYRDLTADIGQYIQYSDKLVVNITSRMEAGDSMPSMIDGYQMELTINEDGTLAVDVLTNTEEGFAVRAVYIRSEM